VSTLCSSFETNFAKILFISGGKLVTSYIKKNGKGPKCGDCGSTLAGVRVEDETD
jgi:ribosomal protein L34E